MQLIIKATPEAFATLAIYNQETNTFLHDEINTCPISNIIEVITQINDKHNIDTITLSGPDNYIHGIWEKIYNEFPHINIEMEI